MEEKGGVVLGNIDNSTDLTQVSPPPHIFFFFPLMEGRTPASTRLGVLTFVASWKVSASFHLETLE